MASPYRTRPTPPPARSTDERRLATGTFAFGFLCVVMGISLAGDARGECALLATLSGFGLLIGRGGPR